MAIILLKKKKLQASGLKKENNNQLRVKPTRSNGQNRKNAPNARVFWNWLKAVRMLAFLRHVCPQESLFILVTENKSPETKK